LIVRRAERTADVHAEYHDVLGRPGRLGRRAGGETRRQHGRQHDELLHEAPPPRVDTVATAGAARREVFVVSAATNGVEASTASRSWNGRVNTGSFRTAMTKKLIAAASSWSTGSVSSSNTARPSCLNQATSPLRVASAS